MDLIKLMFSAAFREAQRRSCRVFRPSINVKYNCPCGGGLELAMPGFHWLPAAWDPDCCHAVPGNGATLNRAELLTLGCDSGTCFFVPERLLPTRSGCRRAAGPVGLTQQGGEGILRTEGRWGPSLPRRLRRKCSPAAAFYQKQSGHSGFFFFSHNLLVFSDKELRWERLDIHSFARNEINTSNSDSSVALIKQSFCLDGVTPRRRGDGRRVLSSPEDETSKKTKPNKERKKGKDPFFFLFLFFCSGWLISSSFPRV